MKKCYSIIQEEEKSIAQKLMGHKKIAANIRNKYAGHIVLNFSSQD